MGEVSTIGLDIAKSVFQVHGVDGAGAVTMRKSSAMAPSTRDPKRISDRPSPFNEYSRPLAQVCRY